MSTFVHKKIELSETFRQWVIKYNATLEKLAELAQSGIGEYDFVVYNGVHIDQEPPAPKLSATGRTIPQTVTYTRHRLVGQTRITQHIAKDHTGEEIIIYETKEAI